MQAAEGGATRMYKFGCGEPREIPREAERQIALETEYWNALVAIEHAYRERERELWRAVPAVEAVEAELERTREELAALRARIEDGDRASTRTGWRARAALLETRRRELQGQVFAAKSGHWEDVAAHIRLLGEWRCRSARAAYGTFSELGLYWGNAMLVRDRYERARRLAERTRRRDGAAGRLHARAFGDDGFWAVRLAHEARDAEAPCTMLRLFSGKSKWSRLLQIDPVDFSGWDSIPRGERRRCSRTRVRIRAASQGRQPVWLEFPLVMHRPLPEDGVVKAAMVVRRRVGTRFAYELLLTVRETCAAPQATAARPALAVALGAEPSESGLRVALCLGADGSRDELVLPVRLLERFHTLERLASLRARAHRAAASEITAWAGGGAALPEWLAQAVCNGGTEHPARLAAVANAWRARRFAGDTVVFARLESWRRRDKRLLEWQANLREKCMGFRTDLYRTFAHRMAGAYGSIVIHKPELRRLRAGPLPEARDDWLRFATRRRLQIAALFTLQRVLEQAFTKRGHVARATPRGLEVWKHVACDGPCDGGARAVERCPTCGGLFDPEINTCRHLVRWAVADD